MAHGFFKRSAHGFFVQSPHKFRGRGAQSETICVITHYQMETSEGEGHVTRVDPEDGSTIWTFDLGTFTTAFDTIVPIHPGRAVIDSEGSIYVAALVRQFTSGAHPRGIVVKLDRDGAEVWRTLFPDTTQAYSSRDPLPGLALDPSTDETELIAAGQANFDLEPEGFWRLDCATGAIIRGYRRSLGQGASGATPAFYSVNPDGRWWAIWEGSRAPATLFDDEGSVLYETPASTGLGSFPGGAAAYLSAAAASRTSNQLYYGVEGPGPSGMGGVVSFGGGWFAYYKLDELPTGGFSSNDWSQNLDSFPFVPEVQTPPLTLYGDWGSTNFGPQAISLGQPYDILAVVEVGTNVIFGTKYIYVEENQNGTSTGRRWGYNMIVLDSNGTIQTLKRRHNPIDDQTASSTLLGSNPAEIRGLAYDQDADILVSLANMVGGEFGVSGFAGPLERWQSDGDFEVMYSVDPRTGGDTPQYRGVAIRTVTA